MGAVRMRVQTADKNMVPVNHCFQRKYESSIYNIAFSSENIISAESGEKYALIKHRLQAKTVLNNVSMDFDVRRQQATFSLEETLLWIMNKYFPQKWWFKFKTCYLWIFLLQTREQEMNRWTVVVWITVMFLSAVWLSFWRHPFTAEDPLVNK